MLGFLCYFGITAIGLAHCWSPMSLDLGRCTGIRTCYATQYGFNWVTPLTFHCYLLFFFARSPMMRMPRRFGSSWENHPWFQEGSNFQTKQSSVGACPVGARAHAQKSVGHPQRPSRSWPSWATTPNDASRQMKAESAQANFPPSSTIGPTPAGPKRAPVTALTNQCSSPLTRTTRRTTGTGGSSAVLAQNNPRESRSPVVTTPTAGPAQNLPTSRHLWTEISRGALETAIWVTAVLEKPRAPTQRTVWHPKR